MYSDVKWDRVEGLVQAPCLLCNQKEETVMWEDIIAYVGYRIFAASAVAICVFLVAALA